MRVVDKIRLFARVEVFFELLFARGEVFFDLPLRFPAVDERVLFLLVAAMSLLL
jgi:hypothetical protein